MAVKIGLCLEEIPDGHFGLVLGRSCLAAHTGIVVLGGVIDNNYRGEVLVILRSLGKPLFIKPGDR
jgi:dUTPase